jgi:hypothetical protein
MNSLDPELAALQAELEELDYVVVDHGDHICVRLPLISSVRIRHSRGRFRFSPQFGPFRRSGGLFFTTGVSIAAVAAAAFIFGASAVTFVVGFLGVVALAHDACRFVLTEGFLTRLQQLLATTGALHSTPNAGVIAAAATRPAISPPPPSTVLDQRVADRSTV